MRLRNLLAFIAAGIGSCGLLITATPSPAASAVEAGNTGSVGPEQYPPGMPGTPYPDIKGCSTAQEAYLKRAWRLAHYYTWRADGLMEHILSQDESQRDDLWSRDYVEGETVVPSPRRWFGAYDSGRAKKVRDAVSKARKRFEQRGEVVKGIRTLRCGQPIAPKPDEHTDVCPGSNIGGNGPPGGYHAPVGVIVTCPSFWDDADLEDPSLDDLSDHATSLVHEIFHWLSVDAKYVTDFHGGLLAKHKGYGEPKSLSLAETQPGFAIYNNDNYAWFTYYVGRYEPSYSAVWGKKEPGGTGGFFVDLSWEELVSWWRRLAPKQYLADVETYVRNGERKYIAVWRVGKGSGALWASEWDDFARKWNELRRTQDLTDIEIYKAGARWMYLGVYKVKEAGASGDGGLLNGLSWGDLAKWRGDLAGESYLADVETYIDAGKRKFIGVWRVGEGTGALYWHKRWDDFSNIKKQLDPTQQLIDFEKFLSDGKWSYLGVWRAARAGGPVSPGLTLAALLKEWNGKKATHTLLKVEEYSALPARIR